MSGCFGILEERGLCDCFLDQMYPQRFSFPLEFIMNWISSFFCLSLFFLILRMGPRALHLLDH